MFTAESGIIAGGISLIIIIVIAYLITNGTIQYEDVLMGGSVIGLVSGVIGLVAVIVYLIIIYTSPEDKPKDKPVVKESELKEGDQTEGDKYYYTQKTEKDEKPKEEEPKEDPQKDSPNNIVNDPEPAPAQTGPKNEGEAKLDSSIITA